MSDTPQTDKLGNELVPLKAGENDFVSALKNWRDLCRKLERERDEARKEVERLKAERDNWRVSSVCRELNAELERLKAELAAMKGAE